MTTFLIAKFILNVKDPNRIGHSVGELRMEMKGLT